MEYQNKQSLMPSKSFLKRGAFATLALVLILTVQTTWFKNLFNKKSTPETEKAEDVTVRDLVGKDTNKNGIADWEEKLWGLDPAVLYTGGISNRQIIEDKKRALSINGDGGSSDNETDALAKQLFTITNALQNNAGADSLQSIGAQLGDTIELKQVSNKYSIKDVTTVKTTDKSLRLYYKVMSDITTKYSNNASEIEAIVSALETGDTSSFATLEDTAKTYKSLSVQLQKVSTPIGLVEYHLALMNGLNGMGESFKYLTQLEDNSVKGLVGIALYKDYSLKTEKAVSDLRDYLQQYGIIQ
jgi:exonuclease VII small subunit